ncbi:sulfhydryl oxidase-2 [Coleophoma crateriformis]|uniref:Sulfhydryl oxidase n=1 Tax=Coleophoma crateriformis TaxID=565419 RepID=A0A3D8QQN3_9HELO|nr:sulfhydryl oxidase-2 [Coleophoma crateriformis]
MPSRLPLMARRNNLLTALLVAVSVFLGISFILTFRNQPEGTRHPDYVAHPEPVAHLEAGILNGVATAPKLENATLKAELGHASWKLFHTMMAKFPDKPTPDDSTALQSYIHLFARLYPCGDCARHFQELLRQFPPQVSSRSSAAAWACHVHNQVNKRLKKPLFDCSNIGDFYDCGCAEEGTPATAGKKAAGDITPLKLEKEALTRGG